MLKSRSSTACLLALAALLVGCGDAAAPSTAIRLIDVFVDATVLDVVEPMDIGQTVLRFDGASTIEDPKEPEETLGWEAVYGADDFGIVEGSLAGRLDDVVAVLSLAKPEGLGQGDLLHAFEIRVRATAEIELHVYPDQEKPEVEDPEEWKDYKGWVYSVTVEAGEDFSTHTMTDPYSAPPPSLGRTNFIGVVLEGPEDTQFAIESLRFITRREELSKVASGPGFHGLSSVYRETLVTRAPETVLYAVDVPSSPWLEIHLGTIDDGPLRFQISVRQGEQDTALLTKTLTTPRRWEKASIDLEDFAGQSITLALALHAEQRGRIGFWGSPAIRSRGASASVSEPSPARAALGGAEGPKTPQGVIVILADTLRRDRLSFYGHDRETTPHLASLAAKGTVFEKPLAQSSWTKVSVPSILTSLYPTTHGIVEPVNRLPAAATTLAEVFRKAGYATFATSSIAFTGQNSNLHQGVEVLHERDSLQSLEDSDSETARAFVDRLLPWLEDHRDIPFFVLLHATDPHDPFEPYPPYDTLYTGADENSAQDERNKTLEAVLEEMDAVLHLPTISHLEKAKIEASAFIDHELAWYDASIRAMDVEVGRLVESLEGLDLLDDVVIAFISDHGEEFLDHGKHFHGTSTYGELINVPLMLHWPGVVPARRVPNVVQTIDLMPTLLELAQLPIPQDVQGQSLLPLLSGEGGGWRQRPAFSERERIPDDPLSLPEVDSFAVVAEGWKLIQNTERPEGHPEFELYDFDEDPLDQHDVAAEHPEVVERLAGMIASWQEAALAARLPSDGDAEMSPEELEQLRALGYGN
jgi:arylsulfatase A-like enzyme